MGLLGGNSFGSRIQTRVTEEFGFQRVPVSEDRGDFKTGLEDYYEVKTSILIHEMSSINVVQVRPWHNCDYLCLVFDLREDTYIPRAFRFTHDEFLDELQQLPVGSAHGTVTALAENKTKELRFTISDTGKHYRRWLENYQSDLVNKLV